MTIPATEEMKLKLSCELQIYPDILSEIHNESPDSDFLPNHPATDETGKLPQNMSDSRFLIQFIEKFGTLRKSKINFNYFIVHANPESDESKEILKDPDMGLLYKAGKLEERVDIFFDLIKFIPCLSGYAPVDKIGELQYLDYHEKVITFSSSIAGKVLGASIVNSAVLEVSSDFNASIREPLFIDALCDLATYYGKGDIKECLLSDAAQIEDVSLSALAMQSLDPLSPIDLKVIATKRETLRRRRRDLTEMRSTKDILLTKWLPNVLWKKTVAEILDCLPELSSGSTEPGHAKDCKKIAKAIRELGLSIKK